MLNKSHVILLIAFGLAVAAAATAIEARAAQPSDDARPGRAEYIEMGCYQCHGYEGQGARSTGPKLAPEPLPLEVFSTWVRHPPDVMPAYSPNVLSKDKLERIHQYLLSIPPPPDVSTLPAFSEN